MDSTITNVRNVTMKSNVLAWVGTIFFGLGAIVEAGVCSPFLALLALNMLPIQKWQDFKRDKLKIGKTLSVIIGIVLFIVGMSLIPTSKDEKEDTPDRNIPVSETTEPSSEDDTTTTTENVITTTTVTTTDTTTSTTTTLITENSTFSIKYIDVGQGDSALIECDGHYMLIDGGDSDSSSKLYSILKNQDIEKLDIVVASHVHSDHIGGLAGALNFASSDLILCTVTDEISEKFSDFKKYADTITVPEVNDTYNLGSSTIDILGVNSTSEANNSSIVLMITYGETKFLFTGDAERDAEQTILSTGADLSCDVLKVGHHGSDSSTSYVWLDAILPEYAVISVGKDNSYGHPTDAVLSRLRDAEVKTYRTDLNGDIYATSDGKTVTITTDKTASDDDIFTEGQIPTEPPTESPTEAPTNPPVVDTPSTRDWVINTNTGKFHYPSCSHAKKIKSSNRWDYNGTRDDVVGMGYSPCGSCHP